GAPVNATLDDVIAAVQGTGAGLANLTGVYTFQASGEEVATGWTFSIAVPFAKLNDTLAALVRIHDESPMYVSFYIEGMQTSPELQASQPCPYPSLVSYARTQVQKVAAAAGVRVGQVVGISDTPSGETVAIPTLAFGIGDTASGPLGGIAFGLAIPEPAATCAMTVQFKLLR